MRQSDPNRFRYSPGTSTNAVPCGYLEGLLPAFWCIEPTEFLNFCVEYTN